MSRAWNGTFWSRCESLLDIIRHANELRVHDPRVKRIDSRLIGVDYSRLIGVDSKVL